MHHAVEAGFLGGRAVFAFYGLQCIGRVGERSSGLVVADIDGKIIVKYIGGEAHISVHEPYLPARVGIEDSELADAVVVKFIGSDLKSVALLHAHVAESIHRTGLGHIVGAVAQHGHAPFGKHDIAHQHHERILLVFGEQVGMFQKHLVGGRPVGLRNLRAHPGAQSRWRLRQKRRKHGQAGNGKERGALHGLRLRQPAADQLFFSQP